MSVATNFAQIKTWCENNAPATAAALTPAASEADLDRAQRDTEQDWPTALLDLYRQAGGADGYGRANLFVHASFVPLDEAVRRWQNMTAYWDTNGPTDSIRQAVLDEDLGNDAGKQAAAWIRPYLPFAENGDGLYLYFDSRLGPDTGCVGKWDKVERDEDGRVWQSVDEMLEQVASVLVGGEDLFVERPVVEDGLLLWREYQ